MKSSLHRQIAETLRRLADLHEELALEEVTPAPERAPLPPAVPRVLPQRQPTEIERAQARRALRRAGA